MNGSLEGEIFRGISLLSVLPLLLFPVDSALSEEAEDELVVLLVRQTLEEVMLDGPW